MSYKTIAIILAAAALSASLSFGDYLRVNDFTGGINTRTAPDKLKDNEAQDITNFAFDLKGSLVKRDGVTVNLYAREIITFNPLVSGNILNVKYGQYQSFFPYEIVYTRASTNAFEGLINAPSQIFSQTRSDISNLSNYFKSKIVSSLYMYISSSTNIIPANPSTPLFFQYVSPFDFSTTTFDPNYLIVTPNGNEFSQVILFSHLTTSSYVYKVDLTEIYNRVVGSGGGMMFYAPGPGSWYIPITACVFVATLGGPANNIDDKESNAVMFSDFTTYRGIYITANASNYANSLKNIYFFGRNNFSWNDYTNSFSNIGYGGPSKIGYSSEGVSGNLNGTYNYACTFIYDNAFESNPAIGTHQDTSTQNYTFGRFLIQLSGFKYIFQQIEGKIYVTKVTTGDIFVANNFVVNGTMFKAIGSSGEIFFSTVEGLIYKLSPSTLEILSVFSNVNSVGGTVWRSPQFSVVGSSIIIFQYVSIEGRYNNIFFNFAYLTKSLVFSNVSRISIGQLGENNPYFPLNIPILSCSDINGSGYAYIRFGNDSIYYINILTGAFGTTSTLLENSNFTIDNSIYGVDNGNNSFYNLYAKSMNILTGTISTTNTYQQVAFSDGVFQFINDSVVSLNSSLLGQFLINNYYYVSSNVSVVNGQNRITIPTSNSSRVTGRNIYRSKGLSGYYLLSSIFNNTTSDYVDNISDIQQSVISLKYDNNIPPYSIDCVYTHARLFYFTSDGTVWYSKLNIPEAVSSWSYIPILSDSDDTPQRIFQMYDGIFAFFSKSIYYIDLSNTNPITWVPRKLNTDYGCPYPNSIVKGKGLNDNVSLFYMAEDNSIRAIDGSGKNTIQIFDNIYTNYISEGVQNQLAIISDNAQDIYSAYKDYSLFISIPSLRTIYVWDMRMNAWTKYVYPIKFKYIGTADNMLLAGDYSTSIIYQLNSGVTTDLGVPIRANYKSKIYPANTEIIKQFDKMWVRGTQYDSGLLTMNVVSNADTFHRTTTMSVNLKSTANITTKLYNLTGIKGRDLQFEISGTPNFRLDSTSFRYQNVDE